VHTNINKPGNVISPAKMNTDCAKRFNEHVLIKKQCSAVVITKRNTKLSTKYSLLKLTKSRIIQYILAHFTCS